MEHAILIVVVVAVCTLLTRALPFCVFRGNKELPDTIKYLGKVLPSAIMIILVIYCLRNVSFVTGTKGIPELVGISVVVILHLWKKNTLLSISIGTLCYMLLV